jgi:8-amino-7-oxononanoate synthase
VKDLNAGLARLQREQLYRSRRVVDERRGAVEVQIDGRPAVNFCGNDYLGLATHPEVAKALARGAARWGTGAGAAHLVSGHTAAHHALEEELAAFVGAERALLFSTGYMANLGVISALCGRGDRVLEDRLNHASMLDGALLSRARLIRYPHGDARALSELLGRAGAGECLVATDGVFSMDGDLAPLPDLARAARDRDAWLLVDDAHGLGVIGATGRGSLEHFRLADGDALVLMGTLGKALGTFGAFVAGSEALIETLIQRARPYIYTTAPPPALAEAARAGLRLAAEEGWRRERLGRLIARFRAGVEELGLPLMPSATPIQPVIAGTAGRARAWSAHLLEQGILAAAIRPPTVPEGSARLRITLCAAHSDSHLERLLDALAGLPEAPA